MARLRRMLKAPATRIRARIRLRRALHGIGGLEGLRVKEILQVRGYRTVARGVLNGQSVIVKLNQDPFYGTSVTQASWDVLQDRWPQMCDGPYRVPKPLFVAPEQGVLLTGFVPGQTLYKALGRITDDGAAQLLHTVLEWHKHFARDHQRTATFGANFWIREAAKAENIPDRLAHVSEDLIGAVERQGHTLGAHPLTQIRAHGDLSIYNMIWDGEVLTGIDLQNLNWQAKERDLARILINFALVRHPTQGTTLFGLPARWATIVNAVADPQLLRFFIGIELHRRLDRKTNLGQSTPGLEDFIQSYLEDMRKSQDIGVL